MLQLEFAQEQECSKGETITTPVQLCPVSQALTTTVPLFTYLHNNSRLSNAAPCPQSLSTTAYTACRALPGLVETRLTAPSPLRCLPYDMTDVLLLKLRGDRIDHDVDEPVEEVK